MERKDDGVLPNPGDVPEKGQTQTPTHDQDQEGDRERKKAKGDDDGTVTEVKSMEAWKEKLQQAFKALEEHSTRLETEIAGFQSKIERLLEIQGEHDAAGEAMARRLKISWAAVLVVASAMAVVVCLRKVKQRESGARE